MTDRQQQGLADYLVNCFSPDEVLSMISKAYHSAGNRLEASTYSNMCYYIADELLALKSEVNNW